MKELVVATRNKGKLIEIAALLDGMVATVRSLGEFAEVAETVEDGETFGENALKKAREACRFTGLPAMADDSGLVVDALQGRPGVYSARFAGEGCGDAANNAKLLAELAGVPWQQRQGAFVCAVALVFPYGEETLFSGRVGGTILEQGRGTGGFGYDPLFLVDGFDRTMAELTLEEKNRISHRGQALLALRDYCEQRKP